jgi:hypothetical protein
MRRRCQRPAEPLGPSPPVPEAVWIGLQRTVAEALLLQDAAEQVLVALRERPDPAVAARDCGRLTRRFAELREALPAQRDPELTRLTDALEQVLDHHILMLKTSVGLLAGAARSERLSERLDAIDGLGCAADRLEALRFDLLWRGAYL